MLLMMLLTQDTYWNVELELFSWLRDADKRKRFVPLKWISSDKISSFENRELQTIMDTNENFILQPSKASHWADIYVQFGGPVDGIIMAIQAKNGAQKITWNKIKNEFRKKGEFQAFTYFVIAAMRLNGEIKRMMGKSSYIRLGPGKYYYHRKKQTNHSLLCHSKRNYHLYYGDSIYELHEVSNDDSNSFSFDGTQLGSSHLNTARFQDYFSKNESFTITKGNTLLILGEDSMKHLISEEAYRQIFDLFVDNSSPNTTVLSDDEFVQKFSEEILCGMGSQFKIGAQYLSKFVIHLY
eukprot:gb/GECH01010604.1/.p1 GENE.gb/GECH01010604.1/~~gb/GECH01010604.1/.p1  ORF type:complete len:296 (+),score=24.64 gb/GECH01010604.1/:1-888(+)